MNVKSGIDFVFVTFPFSNGIIMCDKSSDTSMYKVTDKFTLLFLDSHTKLKRLISSPITLEKTECKYMGLWCIGFS